jgi:hypothetical protein
MAHLADQNLNNFKVIEAIGLKMIASRSPRMALSLLNFMKICPAVPKSLLEDRHKDRHTDW